MTKTKRVWLGLGLLAIIIAYGLYTPTVPTDPSAGCSINREKNIAQFRAQTNALGNRNITAEQLQASVEDLCRTGSR